MGNFKKWIDLSADNGIPAFRCQVSGSVGVGLRFRLQKGVKIVKQLLDQVVPYAAERGVKIGMETHWHFSSYPPFLKAISDLYQDSPGLGIIFDWGNYHNNKDRYQALAIAAVPHNHVYNHSKIFHFDDHFQEIKYDTMKIVSDFREK